MNKLLPKTFVVETQSNTGNGFIMFDNQIETIFVIHNGSKAHDADVDVIFRFAHLNMKRLQIRLKV